MHLKKENVFKFLIFTVAIAVFFTPLSATISVFAEENEQTVTGDSGLPSGETLTSDDETPALDDTTLLDQGSDFPPIQVFANAPVDGGGSKYKFVGKQTVNLSAANTIYDLSFLAAGGLVSKIAQTTIASVVGSVIGGGGSLFKKYNYMSQSIYKWSTKKQDKYKVIDEFMYKKNGKVGYVRTTKSTVKK
ncbi:hypothetical protein GO722_14035 [Listeria monocytogenes]|uniref:hypothetical protein n=1 Tax=Listeria monocytogenes TaxID=1639 RepID=UPI0012EE7407|nr:hypothetical protein [Listeria monocytogenes]MVN84903.1 hypothetical protein [Listeria monocytogenes]